MKAIDILKAIWCVFLGIGILVVGLALLGPVLTLLVDLAGMLR